MNAGSLSSKVHFFNAKYIRLKNATSEQQVTCIKTVYANVKDITYTLQYKNKTDNVKKTLKVSTRYFDNANMHWLVKINNDMELYKIVNIENVNYKRESLIFTLEITDDRA